MLVWEKFRATASKNWRNFKCFNTNLNSEILLNLIRKMKYLSDQFLLFFVFALTTLNSYILFLHWQHNWHPYRQLVTYGFLVFALRYLMQLSNEYSVMCRATIDLKPKARTAEENLILIPKSKTIPSVCTTNVRSYVNQSLHPVP